MPTIEDVTTASVTIDRIDQRTKGAYIVVERDGRKWRLWLHDHTSKDAAPVQWADNAVKDALAAEASEKADQDAIAAKLSKASIAGLMAWIETNAAREDVRPLLLDLASIYREEVR